MLTTAIAVTIIGSVGFGIAGGLPLRIGGILVALLALPPSLR